jgi:hypothetical protein
METPFSQKGFLVVFSVIPAKAGIQCFYITTDYLDPGFRRGNDFGDFLRMQQKSWATISTRREAG